MRTAEVARAGGLVGLHPILDTHGHICTCWGLSGSEEPALEEISGSGILCGVSGPSLGGFNRGKVAPLHSQTPGTDQRLSECLHPILLLHLLLTMNQGRRVGGGGGGRAKHASGQKEDLPGHPYTESNSPSFTRPQRARGQSNAEQHLLELALNFSHLHNSCLPAW